MKAKWEKINVPEKNWDDYDWYSKMNGLEWGGYTTKSKTHPIWVWKWFIVVEDRINNKGNWLIYDGLFDITYSSDMEQSAHRLMMRQKGRYGYNMSIRRKEKPRYAPFTNKKNWGRDSKSKEGHEEYYLYELALYNILRQVAKERIIDQYGDYDKGVEIIKAQLGWQTNATSRLEHYEQFNIYRTLGGYGGLRTKWVAQRLCEYIYEWQLKYLSDQCLLNHSYIWRIKGLSG
jgi:hypothetical protein